MDVDVVKLTARCTVTRTEQMMEDDANVDLVKVRVDVSSSLQDVSD